MGAEAGRWQGGPCEGTGSGEDTGVVVASEGMCEAVTAGSTCSGGHSGCGREGKGDAKTRGSWEECREAREVVPLEG